MKVIFIGLIINLFIINPFFAQQIGNSDFENWIDNNNPENWTCYISPLTYTLYTASRSTDAFSGEYAVEAVTTTLFTGHILPGMVQLGQLDLDYLEPIGGVAFDQRPTAIEVRLKYSPQENDSLVAFCYLSKYNKSINKSTNIGGMYFTYDSPIEEYSLFVFPIYYTDNAQPDTINIGFFSSNQNPHPGSTLWVDDLKLLYGDILLAPQANVPTEISTNKFTANWIGAEYTKSYILDVATDENFTNYLSGYQSINVGYSTNCLIEIPDTTIKQIYYRVRADYDSIISDFSNVMSFAVPYAPIAYEGQDITPFSFTFSWQNIPLAQEYILDIALDNNFNEIFNHLSYVYLSDNNFNVSELTPLTSYFCRVRARYPVSGKSAFSNIIEVKTPEEHQNDYLEFLSFSDKIVILADTIMYNSEVKFHTIEGKLYWQGYITDSYTEIYTPASEVFIVDILRPDGILVRKKIGFIVH